MSHKRRTISDWLWGMLARRTCEEVSARMEISEQCRVVWPADEKKERKCKGTGEQSGEAFTVVGVAERL